MKYLVGLIFLFTICWTGCEGDDPPVEEQDQTPTFAWLVDSNEIIGQGEKFPTAIFPEFLSVAEVTELADDDRVAILKIGADDIRIYPYRNLNRSEVLKDSSDDQAIGISYCPRTKSFLAFDRSIDR